MIEVASSISTNWLTSAGYMRSTAWGRITRRRTFQRFMPRQDAASIWPRGIDSMPARRISVVYADTLITKAMTAAAIAGMRTCSEARPKNSQKA